MSKSRRISKKNISVIRPLESLETRRLMTTSNITGWDLVSLSDSAYDEITTSGPVTGTTYSIRALIYYYNNTYDSSDPFTIQLGNGTYTLSEVNTNLPENGWQGRNDNSNYYGDLDINPAKTFAPLIIQGPVGGSAVLTCSIVDSASLDRLIQVTYGSLQIQNVTLKGGLAWDNGNGSEATDALGGAVLVNPGGALSLTNCNISSNAASATRSMHAGIGGLNAAGGGIYGSAGSVITLSGSNVFNANRAIAGKGGTSSTSTGLYGGNAFGAGLSMRADVTEPDPYSTSETIPSTELSINAESGTNTSFTNNRLNSYINTKGITVNSGGTGGAGTGTGGAGGNAYGAGLYIGSGQLNINGGSMNSPITFTGNQSRGGSGASTNTDVAGANGSAYGAGVYYMPSQVTPVVNSPSSGGILQFSNNTAGGATSGIYIPTVETGDAGYTSANGTWTLRTAVAALNPLVSTGMNLVLDLPAGNISLVNSTSGSNTGSISVSNTGAGSLTIIGASESGSIISNSNLTTSIFNLSSADVTFSNLTITGSNTTGNGGAITQYGGSSTLNDVTLSYNKSGNGGAFYSYGGSFTMVGGSVVGNGAPSGTGGGFFFDGGMDASLSDVNVSQNSAATSGGYGGGLMQDAGGSLTVKNNTMIQNNSSASGAGLYLTGSVVFSGGKISKNTASSIGGGMVISTGGSVNLSNVSVVSNKVASGSTPTGTGGGIYQGNASLNLLGSTVIKNNSSGNYGGVFSGNSKLIATGTKFSGNSASGNGGGLGITNGGTADLSGVTFSGNAASNGLGGGIYQNGGSVNIKNGSKFKSNSASQGGAAYSSNGTTSMNGGIVQNNKAVYYGGGLLSNNNNLNVTGVSVITNALTSGGSPSGSGGGLSQTGSGTLNLKNSVVNNNSAAQGGGLFFYTSTLNVINTTFKSNKATSLGAGIYASNNTKTMNFTSANISSNTISGSGEFSGAGIYVSGGTLNTNGNFNLINNNITSSNSSTIQGAGIYASGTTINFNGGASAVSMISKNSLTSNGSATGAGLYLTNSATLNQNNSLAIINNTITSNNGSSAGNGVGAGVAFASGTSYNGFQNISLVINNGSFETPSQGSSFYNYAYNPPNSNWTWSGDSGITGSGGDWSLNNPPQGIQAAFLQSNNWIISQSISGFASGQNYVLCFQAALRPGYPAGQSITVSMDGNSLGTYTPSSTAFQSFAVPLIGFAAGSHTLEFAGTSTVGSITSAFLDNVQISTSAFGGNFASGGGNDMAFQVAYTGDNSNSAPSYASGINYFTGLNSTGSLRSAINYAQQWMNDGSTSPTSMAIMLSPGTYGLSGSYGQLITQVGNCQELTILGSPASMSTVSASGMATRPFWIVGNNSGTVVLQNLIITGGYVPFIYGSNVGGGGIMLTSGILTLNNTTVQGNQAGNPSQAAGGGNSSGTANGHKANGGNGSTGVSAYGGGIYIGGGTLNLLSNSYVTGNYVYGQNGGNGGNGQNGTASAHQKGGYCEVSGTQRSNGGNGGSGGSGGSAIGGGIYLGAGTLNSPLGWNHVYNNYAQKGNGGASGSGGGGGSWSQSICSHTYTRTSSAGTSPTPNPYYSGSANANYDKAGGQTVFSSNSTASAQSIGGLYQSAGSINQAALRFASVPKRLPGVMIELYSDNDKLIATATTDQNGRYRFNTNYSGIGYLYVEPLKTFVVSEKGSQFSGGVTSAFDPTSGKTDPVQLIDGVVVNTNLNLVLSKIDSGLIVKGNSIRLNRTGTHSALWQTQLMPKSYHGGFTLSTFDVNNDTTPDYVLITKTGKPMAFIVDARTGQSTKLGGQVASNLRNGFVVQTANVKGDSTKELILAPSRERSGRISVIDLQAQKVLWNATDFVLGGMKINQIGSDPSGKSVYSSFQLVSLRQTDTFKIINGATGKLQETVSANTRRAEKRQAMKAEKMQSASIASVPNATQATVSIPRRRLPVMN
jgi:hypothetical protein